MDGLVRSIVVVATDEWLRRGLTHALVEHGVSVLASMGHDEVHRAGFPPGVDTVIVDGLGARDRWDRLAGVAVARHLRSREPRPEVVALLPEDPFGIVAMRMAEVGVTRMVPHVALEGMKDLLQVLDRPVAEVGPAGIPRRATRLGLTARSRINDGIDYIVGKGLEAHFVHDQPLLSRRRLITLRSHLSAVMRIDPVSAGSSAVIERTTPSWRQLRTVVDAARGASFGPEGT